MLVLVLAALAAAPDAPRREPLLALAPVRVAASAPGPTEVPKSLLDARRLADELRFEEALVEYHRYLGDPNRPVAERARALLELGFLHLMLNDEVNAEKRTVEALELAPDAQLPPGAPPKHAAFVEAVRKTLAARAKLEVMPRQPTDAPAEVRTRLADPSGNTRRVLLRHSLSPNGPFHSSPMTCRGDSCVGTIPAPKGSSSFTSWYYAEALDAEGDTLAQAASPDKPLQLAVVGEEPWYQNPWIWGAGAAAIVGSAAVVYLLSPPPP